MGKKVLLRGTIMCFGVIGTMKRKEHDDLLPVENMKVAKLISTGKSQSVRVSKQFVWTQHISISVEQAFNLFSDASLCNMNVGHKNTRDKLNSLKSVVSWFCMFGPDIMYPCWHDAVPVCRDMVCTCYLNYETSFCLMLFLLWIFW